MIQKIIEASIRNRWIVLIIAIALFIWGIFSIKQNPIDAIPDLSENQVIVFTEWMGRSPQLIEDQITYPLVSNLQGIPKVKNIRGTSMFGMSFVSVSYTHLDVYKIQLIGCEVSLNLKSFIKSGSFSIFLKEKVNLTGVFNTNSGYGLLDL